jgi:hypothetical protein
MLSKLTRTLGLALALAALPSLTCAVPPDPSPQPAAETLASINYNTAANPDALMVLELRAAEDCDTGHCLTPQPDSMALLPPELPFQALRGRIDPGDDEGEEKEAAHGPPVEARLISASAT